MDDLLAISLYVQSIILELAEKFKLNKYKIDPPEVYLGWRLENKLFKEQEIWTMSSVDYVKEIINNIEARLTKEVTKLPE